MTDYLVLETAYAGTPNGPTTLKAGRVISDDAFDVPSLQSQGVALVIYNPVTMATSVDAFRRQQGKPGLDGDLTALLIAASAIGGSGGVASVFARVGNVVAAASDYDASEVDNDSGVAGAFVSDALDALAGLVGGAVTSVFGRAGVVVATLGDYLASLVTVTAISPSTGTVQSRLDSEGSVGIMSGGFITDNGDGTVAVSAVALLIRATDDPNAEILVASASAVASLALTDQTMHWVYVEYNAGAPQVVATTTERTDGNTNAILATVFRDGTEAHATPRMVPVSSTAFLAADRWVDTEGMTQASGGMIAETGTRNISITAAQGWLGLNPAGVPAFDSSGADRFTAYYRDGVGGWTAQTAQAQINNSQYDDGTGALASLTGSRYGVYWVWESVDADVYVIFGRGNYTSGQAAAASPPADKPPMLEQYHGLLVGKIVVQNGASVFTSVESAFTKVFSSAAAQSHADLTDLTAPADDHTQYSLADGSRGVAAEAIFQILQTAVPARVLSFVLTALTASRSVTMPDHDVTLNTIRETGGPTVLLPGVIVDGAALVRSGTALVGITAAQVAGQIGGTSASPDVRGLRETSGPTLLTLGSIAIGEFVTRVGSTLVGGTPSGGSGPTVQEVSTVGPTTISDAREVIVLCDTSATGLIALTCNASTPVAGDVVHVIDIAGEAHMERVTVTRAGSQLINGETTIVNDEPFGVLKLTFDGTNWLASRETAWDAGRVIDIEEHFAGTKTPAGTLGVPYFSVDTNGSGSGIFSDPSVSGHPGIAVLGTGTTASGRAGLGCYGVTSGDGMILDEGASLFDTLIRIPTLSTVTEEYDLPIGFSDNSFDNNPDPGVFFRYERIGTGVNWQCVTQDGTGSTVTDSGTAVVASATVWTRLRVAINAAGTEVKFLIDEVIVATHTTDIPPFTQSVRVGMFKSAGTTEALLYVDRIHYRKLIA